MSYVFFPSCKIKDAYPSESVKLAAYLKEKLGVDPEGCCRVGYPKLEAEDIAVVLCNNCAAMIEESSKVKQIEYVWQLIDRDPSFPFPDYHGEAMTIQDCWTAKERRGVQDSVRSLLKKMNIEIIEQKENREKSRYCGLNLLRPCNPDNAKRAPKRYLQEGAHMFTPMSEEEQLTCLKNHCAEIKTDRVVCWCRLCAQGIHMGGKEDIHLIQLLFPES